MIKLAAETLIVMFAESGAELKTNFMKNAHPERKEIFSHIEKIDIASPKGYEHLVKYANGVPRLTSVDRTWGSAQARWKQFLKISDNKNELFVAAKADRTW